jgi:hypothetical protein
MVMGGQGHAHGVRLPFPLLRAAFDIAEEEGDGASRRDNHGRECVSDAYHLNDEMSAPASDMRVEGETGFGTGGTLPIRVESA